MKPQISSRDLKALSLFLDDQLTLAERQRLETRLKGNQDLRQALLEIQQTRDLLRTIPRARAPRNFTLTPQMVGVRSQRSVFPVMGFVSALASILFVLVLAGDVFGFFTLSTRSVSPHPISLLEAAAPTLGMVLEESVQSELSDPSTPIETQAEEALALKAIAPAPDEMRTETNDILPSAGLESRQEMSGTTTSAPEGMYAKEAPAPEVYGSGETRKPEETPVMEVAEKELPPMATPTEEIIASLAQVDPTEADLTPAALSQNAVTATDAAEAVTFSESMPARQPPPNFLRILEVVFAVTALVTAAIFFIQRRKTT